MKKWLIGGLAVLLLGAVALAQVPSLLIASPTGLEQIEVLVPSTGGIVTNSQKQQVTVNQIRNAQGYVLVGAGTTVTTNLPNTVSVAMATGAITTWNVVLPTAPYDAQMMKLTCPGGAVTTLNLSATAPSGVAIVGAAYTSCSAVTPTDSAYHYSAAANTWYRTE